MKQFDIHGSTICYDDWNLDNKPELKEFIKGDKIKQIVSSIPEDIIMVLGGDGSMLNGIGEYHDDGRPFLGINFGHKGFLLNHKKWIQENTQFISRNYPLLEVTRNGETQGVGFNDIHLYSPNGKVIGLEVSREDIGSIQLKGDGCLVATPAGSTGHSKSYRGPTLPHDSNGIIITPKGNIEDESHKIIPGNDKPLIIKNTGRKFELAVNIDGEQTFVSNYDENIEIEIKKIPDKIRLLISEGYEQDWDNKVMQAQGFN